MKPAEHNIHVGEFYRKQFIEQGGFDKLTEGELSSQELNSAISMPLIKPTQADKLRGMEILAENGVKPTTKAVIMHPGSGGAHKCWHLDNFLAVARMLEKEGTDSVFLLGPAEMERFGESAITYIRELGNLITDLPLSDVLAVLSCSRAFLGNDSGITHLAAAVGIRTVAVFGPTDPAVYAPIGPAVTILRNDAPDFTGATSEDLQNKAAAVLLATG
jgi:ADP-heptose:LPS heptosyltransferase